MAKCTTFKEECLNCISFKKGYCIGTTIKGKGFLCQQKYNNGAKYMMIKRRAM